MTRKTPLKKTPFKPAKGKVWKRLQPISKNKERRAKRFMPKDVIQAVLERSQGRCEAFDVVPSGSAIHRIQCSNRAEEIHHVTPRSRGGKHEVDNLLHLCVIPHHTACKTNPIYARKIGILK
jgi:5-methylcytosine-specific restriction endonuclease McrA